jgi:hypothetical protein
MHVFLAARIRYALTGKLRSFFNVFGNLATVVRQFVRDGADVQVISSKMGGVTKNSGTHLWRRSALHGIEWLHKRPFKWILSPASSQY